MSKRTRTAPAPLPAFSSADHERMREMGIRVVSYQNTATPVDSDGRSWWLPRDAIGADGKTLILWRAVGDQANNYATDGWEPWHDGMHGGHYDQFANALAWVQRAQDVRAGKAKDFSGT